MNLPEDIDFTRAAEIGDEIRDLIPDVDGLRIELGGFLFAEFEQPSAELFGLAFAIVILIVAFGSVLAMGLPVGVALFGIGLGGAFVILASHLIEVPDFAPFIGLMIGLGVGIDYALLDRHPLPRAAPRGARRPRVDRASPWTPPAARSCSPGATVVISLLGMLLMGIGFVGGLGITASLTVAVTVVASITLLPALLGFAGDNIERTKWRGLVAAGFVAVGARRRGPRDPRRSSCIGLGLAVRHDRPRVLRRRRCKREVQHRPPKPRRETVAYRWSRVIQHRPWIVGHRRRRASCSSSPIPVLSLRLGFSDESNFADDTTTKQAYDLVVEGFGKGSTGPIYLVAEVDGADQVGSAGRGQRRRGRRPRRGVGPRARSPTTRPTRPPCAGSSPRRAARRTSRPPQLVNRLRDDVLPPIEQAAGTDVLVSGLVAANVDMSPYMGERMPIFFGAVLALSFLLLMVVFRSLLVPLKAVIMNLLSIGAAYGVIVALFQWGWLSDLTGVQPGPIETWVPMMLFAVVFGLSMDYEVFLLSRVREEWQPHRRQPHLGGRRPRRHGQGHHRRRRDHGRRLRQLHARVRAHHEDDGHRSRRRDPLRRHHRPHAARARRRWSCSATATGGCRAGSTGCSPTSTSKGTHRRPRARPNTTPRPMRSLTGSLSAATDVTPTAARRSARRAGGRTEVMVC